MLVLQHHCETWEKTLLETLWIYRAELLLCFLCSDVVMEPPRNIFPGSNWAPYLSSNYVISGVKRVLFFLPFNPDVVFAFTSISAVITLWRAAIKEKKSHSPVVSCILTNRVNVGQLKSKIGWLQISVYFIINMNCPMCVLCYKLCSQMTQYYLIYLLLSCTTVKCDACDAACVWWHIYNCCGGFCKSIKLGAFGGPSAVFSGSTNHKRWISLSSNVMSWEQTRSDLNEL